MRFIAVSEFVCLSSACRDPAGKGVLAESPANGFSTARRQSCPSRIASSSKAELPVVKSLRKPPLPRRGLRVVALGGGTGLSRHFLRGLKEHVVRSADHQPTLSAPSSILPPWSPSPTTAAAPAACAAISYAAARRYPQLHGGALQRRSSPQPLVSISLSSGPRPSWTQLRQSFSRRPHQSHGDFGEDSSRLQPRPRHSRSHFPFHSLPTYISSPPRQWQMSAG